MPTGFSIFDSSDQNKLIKEAMKLLEIGTANFSPGTIHAAISNAKNQLITAEGYAREAADWVSYAKGLGVPGTRCETAETFDAAFARAMAEPGPKLIEAVVP